MSILIKGMAMPKNCFLCPLSVLSENRLFCELTSDEVVRAKIDKDCPLVEVKPHGRLIDADELTTVTEMVNGEFKTYIEEFEINDAPTIIEASPYRYEMLSKTDKPHGIYIIESEGET